MALAFYQCHLGFVFANGGEPIFGTFTAVNLLIDSLQFRALDLLLSGEFEVEFMIQKMILAVMWMRH